MNNILLAHYLKQIKRGKIKKKKKKRKRKSLRLFKRIKKLMNNIIVIFLYQRMGRSNINRILKKSFQYSVHLLQKNKVLRHFQDNFNKSAHLKINLNISSHGYLYLNRRSIKDSAIQISLLSVNQIYKQEKVWRKEILISLIWKKDLLYK